jgi:hypothetical protein
LAVIEEYMAFESNILESQLSFPATYTIYRGIGVFDPGRCGCLFCGFLDPPV